MVQRRLIGAAVAAIVAAGVQSASAAILFNGDFESTTASPMATFSGWNEAADVAFIAPAPGLNSGKAMQIIGLPPSDPTLRLVTQTFTSTTSAFTVSVQFAAIDPGVGSGKAAFRIQLADSSTKMLLNIKLLNDGFKANDGSWQATGLTMGASDWTTDFASPVVNTLTIAGQFTPSSSSYTLSLNGGVPTSTLSYLNGPPTNLAAVRFLTENTTNDFVVDNVSVSIPEPAGILAAAGSLGLLAIRRRQVS